MHSPNLGDLGLYSVVGKTGKETGHVRSIVNRDKHYESIEKWLLIQPWRLLQISRKTERPEAGGNEIWRVEERR